MAPEMAESDAAWAAYVTGASAQAVPSGGETGRMPRLMQLALDNGARRVLVPTANKKHALDLEGELLELAEFYNDPLGAIDKSIGAS